MEYKDLKETRQLKQQLRKDFASEWDKIYLEVLKEMQEGNAIYQICNFEITAETETDKRFEEFINVKANTINFNNKCKKAEEHSRI